MIQVATMIHAKVIGSRSTMTGYLGYITLANRMNVPRPHLLPAAKVLPFKANCSCALKQLHGASLRIACGEERA